jgi:hypothetical protein|nr:MAG TPA: hypothetical protein [Caudoviricetes sp.]
MPRTRRKRSAFYVRASIRSLLPEDDSKVLEEK